MDRNTILTMLRRHRDELTDRGVASLSVVGSVARDEFTTDSDVDVVVTLAIPDKGFAYFRRLDELQQRLSEILGRHVDLMEEAAISPRVRREIERDRVRAF
ncbi:MAG TPA: nucleotidyltransferase family protein [Hyphomicrobium sp.]